MKKSILIFILALISAVTFAQKTIVHNIKHANVVNIGTVDKDTVKAPTKKRIKTVKKSSPGKTDLQSIAKIIDSADRALTVIHNQQMDLKTNSFKVRNNLSGKAKQIDSLVKEVSKRSQPDKPVIGKDSMVVSTTEFKAIIGNYYQKIDKAAVADKLQVEVAADNEKKALSNYYQHLFPEPKPVKGDTSKVKPPKK